MFYETAQTVGPGWHRSYKPSHYEDMSWTPSSRHFRSPGSSPETYRRIIRTEEDFPTRTKEPEEFFNSGSRRSPTFPRRIFKEVWNETSPSSNHRFAERPRMFKRVFKPSHWEDEVPNMRRAEFDRNFDDTTRTSSRKFDDEFDRPSSRRFDEDFDRRFSLQKDIEDEFEKSEGRVHHIPIMVERRMEDLKSRFSRNSDSPPDRGQEDEYSEDWSGPQVQRLRKAFEPTEDGHPTRHHRAPREDFNSKPRAWDPHAVHTLPTRKAHKSSQSFDDSRHPVPPKYVFRSYSETHEDIPKPGQAHSAAFRSHSDGHCPNQTYVTKIEVNLPSSKKEKDEMHLTDNQSEYNDPRSKCQDHPLGEQRTKSSMSAQTYGNSDNECQEDEHQGTSEDVNTKPKYRGKYDSPSLQQIAAVLQNVEDLVGRVEGYSGTGRDKQYRFLDEMLTRCMLRLDDVDTEGREDIRSARKAALREVQSCVDRLEAKADESERRQKSNPQVIPLGGVDAAVPQVIPLGGVSNAIPLGNVTNAIPLEDVPNKTDGKNDEVNEEEHNDFLTESDLKNNNGEQTKL